MKRTLAALLIAFTLAGSARTSIVYAAISIDTVVPSSGSPGDNIVVTGSGCTPVGDANLYWDAVQTWDGEKGLLNITQADANGDFEAWFDVPQAVNGVHYVWVRDADTGLTDYAPFTVLSKLVLSPSSGLPTDRITMRGYGFSDQARLTSITLGGDALTTSPSVPETDSLGSWTATFIVPDKPYGTYPVYAEDEFMVSATAEFTIGRVISFDIYSGPVGSVVTVDGRGFTAGGTVDSITIDSTPCSTLDAINIDAEGRFTGEFVIPSVSTVGVYLITVVDDGGLQGSNNFEVTGLASIELDPPYGVPGATIDVYGYHFTAIAGEAVYLELWDVDLTSKITDLETFYTDATGDFAGAFRVPAFSYGVYMVVARQDDWSIRAQKPFKIGLMIVILNPNEGPVDAMVTLTGTGFTPLGEWNATFGDIVIFDGEMVNTDSNIDGTFYVPMVDPGTYIVSVFDVATGIELTVEFEVTFIYELGAWASETPLIDGEIFPDEWGDADSVDLTFEYGAETHSVTLYVKNDYSNLYIALVILGEDYNPADSLTLYFDNDDDGSPEVGDDVLKIIDNVFSDMHIYDTVNRLSTPDYTIDGIGASSFTATPEPSEDNWAFELAHPLNSANDLHDFSLTIGDDVGFYLEYWDQDAADSDAWPTSPPTWPRMATISTKMPMLIPEFPAGYDLTIEDIEVTQAVQHLNNSMPLVRGKDTVVRLYVDIGNRPWYWTTTATVQLYGVDGDTGETLQPLTETSTVGPLLLRDYEGHTENFLLPNDWLDRENILFKAYVKGPDLYVETDVNNNWMMIDGIPELDMQFQQTMTMTIHIVPINIAPPGDPPQVPPQNDINAVEEYLQAIYPIADVAYIQYNWQLIGAVWTGDLDDLIVDLNAAANNLGIVQVDQMFGLLPAAANVGGTSDPPWNGGLGVVACGSTEASSQEGVMAHEIIHNLGPGDAGRGWGRHTFQDLDWPYNDNNINEYGATSAWGWPPLIIPPDTPDIMSYDMSGTFPTKWISPYRWENMFNFLHVTGISAFSSGSTASTMDILQISGWVSQNGEGALNPVFRLEATPLQPVQMGICSIELQDNTGTVLFTKSFNPTFTDADGNPRDPFRFIMFLPYQPNTARVILKWKDTVLDAIQMSRYPPSVLVVSPNGGETIKEVHTITWQGRDLDLDPLKYMIKYSPDNGATWMPLVIETDTNSVDYDFSMVPGSDRALIRVIATDGFNTAHDDSDGTFRVALKAPQASIVLPSDVSDFRMYDVIVFKGRGYDPEDGHLPDDAYSWSSNVDGPLGKGKALDMRGSQLTLGTHLISLTVRDSDGMEGTNTVSIRVLKPWGPATVEAYAPWLGAALDEFQAKDDVYCRGEGYKPDDIIDIYLVEDVAVWTSGIDLKGLNVASLVTDVQIDSVGNLQSTLVWAGPLTIGNYDLVVDVDQDGVYVAGIDALDDNDVNVSAGLFVIPELPFGTILALTACIAGLVLLRSKRKNLGPLFYP